MTAAQMRRSGNDAHGVNGFDSPETETRLRPLVPTDGHAVELAPGYRTTLLDDGAGAAAVLLHGTPFDVRAWNPVVASLGGRRRAIRFDARGHGSAVAVPVPRDYRALAADVVALLDLLGLHDVHLVGHSWGGQIAQRVALDHPERVNRLSLLCTRSSPFPAFRATASGLRDGSADPLASLDRWFTPEELAEPGGLAVTVGGWLRQANRRYWADALDMIAGFDVLDNLPRITMPVDVVAAEFDGVATAEHMAQIAAALSAARLHVLAGARHLAPLQSPDDIVQILQCA